MKKGLSIFATLELCWNRDKVHHLRLCWNLSKKKSAKILFKGKAPKVRQQPIRKNEHPPNFPAFSPKFHRPVPIEHQQTAL